jgi:tRNA_anti-like
MKSIWRSPLVMVSLLASMSCQPASLGSPKPISVRTLAEEYQRSSAAVRSKYDGKEIIVSGYAVIAPTLSNGDDQGSVQLEEKDQPAGRVVCWFSKDHAEQFSKLKGGQHITVKGVFNGEVGAELKFCKLVRIEAENVYKG